VVVEKVGPHRGSWPEKSELCSSEATWVVAAKRATLKIFEQTNKRRKYTIRQEYAMNEGSKQHPEVWAL
jgi:hypothetical protein